MLRDAHEQNRRSWNLVIPAHDSHKRDQAGFLRAGGHTLFPDELGLLGVDTTGWPTDHVPADMSRESGPLAGRELLHLQCNVGQDTLSLARLGARVTGVDISDEAIAFATTLARDAELPATFIRGDVYDFLTTSPTASFDLAFASYGVLIWLSDLTAWAAGVARILKPGGRLVLLEFHPFAATLDEQQRPSLYPYFGEGRAYPGPAGIGDYVGDSGPGLTPMGFLPGESAFHNPHPTQEFSWTVGEILTAILRAGLHLEQVREYPYANGCRLFADMRELPGRRFAMPAGALDIPLMLGLTARRPG